MNKYISMKNSKYNMFKKLRKILVAKSHDIVLMWLAV